MSGIEKYLEDLESALIQMLREVGMAKKNPNESDIEDIESSFSDISALYFDNDGSVNLKDYEE